MSQPRIEVRDAQPYAGIRTQATLSEWGAVNALVGEVMGWVAAHDLAVDGGSPLGFRVPAPLFRYYVVGDHETPFDVEVGVPVRTPIDGDGRVQGGTIPGGSYAIITHHGHPDRFEESFAALETWRAAENRQWDVRDEGTTRVWGSRLEQFLTDPTEQPDPETWTSEIAFRLHEGTG
ncbi:AraC family transcriptional regulator [Egibacter rhizosphaerae]|uniref:AraC family transcriptional regulator n=1 Tax=Egibacter rhizosphaerae TaxID=1670831 RepID=A0A411YBT0_9ACTN|nr:GyrI-like domain-containing protein [Egibacter rhizosphaerae]QBI18713.1 AraC family transcriptional regulator [Egibacter rhizosphaerae]